MRLTQVLFRNLQLPVADHAVHDAKALSLGIAMVRKVLKENRNRHGWKTQEIYDMALKEAAPANFKSALPVDRIPLPPPHPEHPLRSKAFLKEVLGHLRGYRDIKLIRDVRPREGSTATDAVFVWKHVDKSTIRKPKPQVAPKPTVATAVGAHEDWSHLNRRRQRARNEKILKVVRELKGKKVKLTS